MSPRLKSRITLSVIRDEIIIFLSQRGVLRGDDLLHCDHLPSLHGGGGDQLHREYCLRHLLSIGRKTTISKTNQTKQLFQKQIMTTGAKAVYNNCDRAKHLKHLWSVWTFITGFIIIITFGIEVCIYMVCTRFLICRSMYDSNCCDGDQIWPGWCQLHEQGNF